MKTGRRTDSWLPIKHKYTTRETRDRQFVLAAFLWEILQNSVTLATAAILLPVQIGFNMKSPARFSLTLCPLSLCPSVSFYSSLSVSVCQYLSVSLMFPRVSVCKRMCTFVCVCVRLCVRLCMCVCACTLLSRYLSVFELSCNDSVTIIVWECMPMVECMIVCAFFLSVCLTVCLSLIWSGCFLSLSQFRDSFAFLHPTLHHIIC